MMEGPVENPNLQNQRKYRSQMDIKQEQQELERNSGNFESRKPEEKKEDNEDIDFLMQENLNHVYNYIALRNGEIVCFICQKLIDHEHIKVF
jgi:hypothetical protein